MIFISHGTKYNTIEQHVNAPLFKKVFDSNSSSATLKITVVGLYKLYLNGKLLNRSFFAPYMSNPDHNVFTDTYNLDNLKPHDNVLCVLLGNGFACADDADVWLNTSAPYRGAPKFALTICNGDSEILQADESFYVTNSPITYDDFRCGERYDARLEIANVLTDTSVAGFERATIAQAPKGVILNNNTQPIVAGKPRQASAIFQNDVGYVYEFNINDTGVCTLTLNGTSGQQIDMTFGELLCGNRVDMRNISFEQWQKGFVQHDVYICKDGEQSYTPSFTWHGFRYCEVVGLTDEQATFDALTFTPTHSDLPSVSTFKCNDSVINKLAEITLRSDLSNFVFYPYDCPHREKNGWTADALLSCEQTLYSFDAFDSYRQWLTLVRSSQRSDGALPGIVPTAGWGFDWGNGPAWDGALVEVPYQLYRFYGNEQVVVENAQAISKYFHYITSRLNDGGLVEIGLGDWCQTYTDDPAHYETPLEITDSLVMLDLSNKAMEMFQKVGIDTQYIEEFRRNLLQNFRNKYVKDNTLTVQTQTALSMSLHLGVFEDDTKAFADLLSNIHAQNDHFRVGVVGYRHLFATLTDHGMHDLCYKLIAQDSFPSYGYFINLGASTLWEVFDDLYRDENGKILRKDGMKLISSYNHHFWGGVLAWVYKCIGWIDVVSSNKIIIRPVIIDGIHQSKMTYSRNGNSISVSWKHVGNQIVLDVQNDGFDCELELANEIKSVAGTNSFQFDVSCVK